MMTANRIIDALHRTTRQTIWVICILLANICFTSTLYAQISNGFLTDATVSYDAGQNRYTLSVSGYAWTTGYDPRWGTNPLDIHIGSSPNAASVLATVTTPEYMQWEDMLYMCGGWDWSDPPNCPNWI